ncbi:amino acid ABC transporter substrate-binding protein [Desulfolithobacter dissulfuricans]|uniref:Amino acid ABC transporter substrate-binding protein n=1 Tax=Desulfolithobacter dissulfuricans TaxID=2795293 RepID=A0A915XK69_9BACT|nr:transporter substrate-binding domain-containing protein [Desulfolithobacter dissulfuricans]BCO09597.1 amino acid ABC transporter substrate-binding protein [Desulfolithobacter dissulfuricans]
MVLFSRFLPVLMGLVMLASVCRGETYTVYTEPLPPVHYVENNRVTGIATEIVREIFRLAGMDLRIEVYPWKRAYHMVLKNPGTFIYTINRTPQREKLFKWIGPILSKRTSLYRFKDRRDIVVHSVDDLKHYTTAVILGYALTQKLQALGFEDGRELIITKNKKTQMRVFLKGRADLITGNEYTIFNALKAEGFSPDVIEPVLLMSEKGYYLAANIQTDDVIVQRLREANDKLQQTDFIQKTIDAFMQR